MEQGNLDRGSSATAPPLGRRHTVDGRSLVLDRSGAGGPAVIFLPGGTAIGLDYLMLHQRVGEFTTSVIYDRGGTGWSEPVDLPRSCTEVAQELHDLLQVAGVAGPYVLIAHSLSGLHSRRFTQMFPDTVAGVVGMEPMPEFWDEYMPEQFSLGQSNEADAFLEDLPEGMLQFLRDICGRMFAQWPDGLRETLIAWHLDQDAIRTAVRERSNDTDQAAEIRNAGPVPDRSLITFTGLEPDPGMQTFMTDQALDELTRAKRALFDRLAASATDSEHRILDNTSHGWMHIEAADTITQGIHDMVTKTRQ